MKKKQKQKGITLVNVLISMALMGLILPAVYGTLFAAMSSTVNTRIDADLQGQTRNSIQRLTQDIKSARAIFNNDTEGIEQFKKTHLKNSVKETSFTDNKGAPASAMALMSYKGKSAIGAKDYQLYKLVVYYLEEGKDNNDQEYNKLLSVRYGTPRNLIRIESQDTYFDSSNLMEEQIELAVSEGLYPWQPPENGARPVFPVNIAEASFNRSTIASSITPADKLVNGVTSGKAGGLSLSRNNNLINITILTMAALPDGHRSFSGKSQVSARNM